MTLREQAKAVTGGVLAGLGALLTAVAGAVVGGAAGAGAQGGGAGPVTAYTWLWIGWFAYFAGVEGWALYASWRRRKQDPEHVGGTLSEHVWAWFGTAKGTRATGAAWARRGVLLLFVAWLSVHFLGGGQIV